MSVIQNERKYLFVCIIIAIALCVAQVMGNTILILGALALFMLLLGWCCCGNFTLPILLFFLPWSPIMRLATDSFSFYTFGLLLVCLLGIIRKRFAFRQYQIKSTVILLAITLLSKLLDGSSLTFSYAQFVIMLLLFPIISDEQCAKKYNYYVAVVFFGLGIIIASLCAMHFSEYSNIRKFIRVDSYLTIVRRCGFYGDPNFYVAQILAALGGSLVLMLQESKKRIIVLGIQSVFLLYCGFLSGSKSFVLIFALILFLWIVALLSMPRRTGLKIVLLMFLGGVTLYVATSDTFGELINVIITRFSFSNNLDSFTTGRSDLWVSYAKEIFGSAKVFFLGKGYTNVKVNGRGSHNTIIQSFYQFGLIGVPVLFYWVSCYFRQANPNRTAQHKAGLKQWIVIVGSFIPWLAIDVLFFDEFFLFPMYVCLAIKELSQASDYLGTNEIANQYGGKYGRTGNDK